MKISPLAGKPAPPALLVNVPKLVAAYYTNVPDPSVPGQRVAFGTSGHRGSSFETSFNEWHVLAISQAICEYRAGQGINGPLYIGIDTHALSQPAFDSALEVLAGNGVETMIAAEVWWPRWKRLASRCSLSGARNPPVRSASWSASAASARWRPSAGPASACVRTTFASNGSAASS